jgi:hypothetical protein
MTEPQKYQGHGPDACEGCGIFHTPSWWHYDSNGEPIGEDLNQPELREVVFYGFDGDGRSLWSDAEEKTQDDAPGMVTTTAPRTGHLTVKS